MSQDNKFNCQLCRDIGSVGIPNPAGYGSTYRDCECKIRKHREQLLRAIPARFRECSFHTYIPRDPNQRISLDILKADPLRSYFIVGPYGNGKTHLLWAQYRELIAAGKIAHSRTIKELFAELQAKELGDSLSAYELTVHQRHDPHGNPIEPERYHLLLDDIDKCKPTDFRTEALFDLIDTIYRHNFGLTITSNSDLRELQGEKCYRRYAVASTTSASGCKSEGGPMARQVFKRKRVPKPTERFCTCPSCGENYDTLKMLYGEGPDTLDWHRLFMENVPILTLKESAAYPGKTFLFYELKDQRPL